MSGTKLPRILTISVSSMLLFDTSKYYKLSCPAFGFIFVYVVRVCASFLDNNFVVRPGYNDSYASGFSLLCNLSNQAFSAFDYVTRLFHSNIDTMAAIIASVRFCGQRVNSLPITKKKKLSLQKGERIR